MTWLPVAAAGEDVLDRTLGLLPEAHRMYRELEDAVWACGLDRALLERCQARIAHLVGDTRTADPRRAREASRPDRLSEPDRAALSFAEQFVLDPHGVTDDMCAAVVRELGEAGAAGLTLAVAVFEATSRFRVALQNHPAEEAG